MKGVIKSLNLIVETSSATIVVARTFTTCGCAVNSKTYRVSRDKAAIAKAERGQGWYLRSCGNDVYALINQADLDLELV
jgi:hypothetical protein